MAAVEIFSPTAIYFTPRKRFRGILESVCPCTKSFAVIELKLCSCIEIVQDTLFDHLLPVVHRKIGGIFFYRLPSVRPSVCLHKLNMKT